VDFRILHGGLLLPNLAALSLAGCTFFTEGNPRLPVSVQAPEGMPAANSGAGRRVLVQVPFEDKRPDRDHCGMQKKTYGVTPGFVYCTTPPEAELARLLAERLRAAGFDVTTGEVPGSADTVRIEGRLLQFFVEPVRPTADLETDIHVKLRATTASGLEAEREFYKKGRGSDFQRSVNSGVRKILTAMVAAVSDLMDRNPALGQPVRGSGRPGSLD
jgi:hypothetical protein